jgi:hypothetical protein
VELRCQLPLDLVRRAFYSPYSELGGRSCLKSSSMR